MPRTLTDASQVTDAGCSWWAMDSIMQASQLISTASTYSRDKK
jgi:hypothetical protein